MKLLALLALAASMAVAQFTGLPFFAKPQPKFQSAAASVRENEAMHRITMASAAEGAGCSASAVGPHTILTAGHCVVGGTAEVKIDGRLVRIVNIQYDKNDHALFVLNSDDISFEVYLPIDEREPINGEHVRIWGNPGTSVHVYREGYYESSEDFLGEDGVKRTAYRYLLPIYAGDSGSGLVSDSGRIISVVSMGNQSAESLDFVLQFTQEQLNMIR